MASTQRSGEGGGLACLRAKNYFLATVFIGMGKLWV